MKGQNFSKRTLGTIRGVFAIKHFGCVRYEIIGLPFNDQQLSRGYALGCMEDRKTRAYEPSTIKLIDCILIIQEKNEKSAWWPANQ